MSEKQGNNLLRLPLIDWISISLFLLVTVAFLAGYYGYVQGNFSAVEWLVQVSNQKTGGEHSLLVPFLSCFLLWHTAKGMKHEVPCPSKHGMWPIVLGALLSLAAARTQQPRLALGAVPFLLSGLVWYYWGLRIALKTAFPFFFFWIAIPVPTMQQATVGLQQLAAQLAHQGAGICGVQTILEGTTVTSADGSWDSYDIAGGCSGMHSLMALLMISLAWAYLANKLAMWKRVLLALSAIPLSIVGNAFRVTSIFVCAEYIDPSFAGKTWHDWSGLLFFFPASLAGLTLLHGLLAGEIPFLKKRRVVTRTHNASPSPERKGDEM